MKRLKLLSLLLLLLLLQDLNKDPRITYDIYEGFTIKGVTKEDIDTYTCAAKDNPLIPKHYFSLEIDSGIILLKHPGYTMFSNRYLSDFMFQHIKYLLLKITWKTEY